jgi:hypothetical protein
VREYHSIVAIYQGISQLWPSLISIFVGELVIFQFKLKVFVIEGFFLSELRPQLEDFLFLDVVTALKQTFFQ